jgi:hypothetical protein
LGGSQAQRFILQVRGQAIASTRLQVFDSQGRLVYDSDFVPGSNIYWEAQGARGRPLANGIYLYVVTVRGFDGRIIQSEVKKFVVLR